MLVKILGIFDLLAALVMLVIAIGLKLPHGIIIFFIVGLFLKSLFILTGDIISFFDLASGIILLVSLWTSLPKFILLIFAFFLFQKGFFSVVA